MTIRGIIMSAELAEDPAGDDRVELHCRLQGVGPTAPRRFVIPFEMLLADPALEPDAVAGRAFQAEAAEAAEGRWVVSRIEFAARSVLRPKE